MISDMLIKVVVVDNNDIFRKTIINSLEKEKNIKVVGEASNGEEALNLVLNKEVDLVILDVILPKKDGLWLLEEIGDKCKNKPKCIVVSAMNCDSIVKKAVEAGASYFLSKPFESELLIKRILQIFDNEKEVIPTKTFTEVSKEKTLEMKITEVLNSFGITPSIMGFHYIRCAIEMAVYNTELLIGITKGIYPDIAKKYNTSSSKVERAIRHAIECIWRNGNSHIYCKTIGIMNSKKPTNSQFISILTEYFRLGMINDKTA